MASMEPRPVRSRPPRRTGLMTDRISHIVAAAQRLESFRALTDRAFGMTTLVDEESIPRCRPFFSASSTACRSSFVQAKAGMRSPCRTSLKHPAPAGSGGADRRSRVCARPLHARNRGGKSPGERSCNGPDPREPRPSDPDAARAYRLRGRHRSADPGARGALAGVTVLGVDWTTCERTLMAPGAMGYPRCEAAGRRPLDSPHGRDDVPVRVPRGRGRWMEDLDRAVESWSGPPRGARAQSVASCSPARSRSEYFQLLDDRIRGSLAAA